MKNGFALFVAGSMVLGVVTGYICNQYLGEADVKTALEVFKTITDVFLRLVKMIIAPLVLTTLIAGIGHMEDAATVGRIGAKTLAWFLGASVISLIMGAAMVEWLRPGAEMAAAHLEAGGRFTAPAMTDFSVSGFVAHLVPSSIFEALAKNEILQIVVFAVFVGTAVAAIDDKAPEVMKMTEKLAEIMLKVTEFVMKFAPFAIFASLAATVTQQGLPVLMTYAKFVGGFYISLAALWALLFAVAFLLTGKLAFRLFGNIREAILLSFSTASSEAAYPRLLDALPKSGIPRKIVSFVLPLGYSFNLDGSMMYCTFAMLFIMQAHGVQMTPEQIVGMLALLLITSKGIAGVPRASLVVVMATLAWLGYPEAWIGIVLAVDHLLDMGRSATNVVGNAVASTVVAKWEGQLSVTDENRKA